MLPLIPLFPFVGFLVNATLGKRLPKSLSGGIACVMMLLSFALSVISVWSLAGMDAGSREIEQRLFSWISSGDFNVDVAFRLDPLSALMILVITGIGSLIHIYSTAYMHEETVSEFARYFSYLNLFCFFMLVLVLGSNILMMFVGWEGVGLCSYLLIGYYYQKKSASDAANKAFIVNRIGDYAFILGALLIFVTLGTLDFKEIAARAAAMPVEVTFGTLSLITLLLFIGATGKSAQIPLYVWLPDAMEGPTPVSALIHAATMVTAGVYMIGRTAVLFEHAPFTLTIVAVVGAATALFAGTIGLVQNDIKRVLAYSTVSQLGYMFLAMGVGAFGAGIFHLYTHAFFKALLFLGSGAVIHALHGEQDIRRMGGLKKHLPITYWTFVIGAIAIAGVPGLAGFFSKDEILFETFYRGYQWLWVVGVLTSLLTAVYMFRLVNLTFHGDERFTAADLGPHAADPHDSPEPGHTHAHGNDTHVGHGHPVATHRPAPTLAHGTGHAVAHSGGHGALHLHDAPPAMAIALVVLAIGSVAAGYIGIPHALGGHNTLGAWLEPVFEAPGHSTAASLSGMLLSDCEPGAPDTTTAGGALAGMAIADCEPGSDIALASLQPPVESGAAGRDAGVQPAPSGAEASDHEAADEHAKESLELTLMAVSSAIALLGIFLAYWLWLKRPDQPERMAGRFPGLHRMLLNKYYVDEFYDLTVVQPVRIVSEDGLWRGMDARVVDGAVNGTGQVVGGVSAVMRLLQSGSVKAYAASTFMGVVLILAYYLWK
ncbi:MAG TPA: NADH-quinone oxidoreductase subunit L [Vicinamibacterales bacterium]|nr:NADH-quinone oxidoreductase subunit L [Vicinamibacterales bacterium]